MRIDKLALQFFDKPEHFGAAMKLLHQQAKAWDEYGNLPDVEEHFYSHIERLTSPAAKSRARNERCFWLSECM